MVGTLGNCCQLECMIRLLAVEWSEATSIANGAGRLALRYAIEIKLRQPTPTFQALLDGAELAGLALGALSSCLITLLHNPKAFRLSVTR